MDCSTLDAHFVPGPQGKDVLGEVLRQGAQRLLAQAIEAEVAGWIDSHRHLRDEAGHRQVVRNGSMPARTITTGVGPVEVKQPRVHDRRPAPESEKFTSQILPPYLRKTKSLEELIPWLYLKGVSTGDFSAALAALVGVDAPGLSATTVTRLKGVWESEYQAWSRRSLEGKHYVYVWADGIYFNVRPQDDRPCILVLMGATADGNKELIAIEDGFRESEQSWRGVLLDCKARGLVLDPKVAVGDGALGFWKTLAQVYPTTREQRCWVHKTANVLDKLPKSLQPKVKEMWHAVWQAATRHDADQAFDLFVATFEAKYPKATPP
jgi:putative transposase